MQALLPNEKAWSFKWFFENAFPGLVTKAAMKSTKFVITDGDLVCINQLEDALANHMPSATRGRCSWHIIDRGWTNHVRLALGGHSKKKRPPHLIGTKRKKPKPLTLSDNLGRVFYRWFFSWAQPGYCMSEDEFNVSQKLFFFLLEEPDTSVILGETAPDTIKIFYQEHVYPHLQKMCFYHRLRVNHLEEHTNCGHEGTNNGIKNSSAPVTPMDRVDKAVDTLSFNQEIKSQEIKNRMCQKNHTKKCWSNSPTSHLLTDLAEGILCQEWDSGKQDYNVVRTSQFRWLVAYKGSGPEATRDTLKEWIDDKGKGNNPNKESEGDKEMTNKILRTFGLIPRFKRAYEITRDSDSSTLKCSCGFWERMKLPCRHIAAVILSCQALKDLHPEGFPPSSVGVRWFNSYYYYGVEQNPEYKQVHSALKELILNDSKGFYCPSDLPTNNEITVDPKIESLFLAPARERVLNYSKEQMQQVFPCDDIDDDYDFLTGLSQSSFFPEDSQHPLYDMPDPHNTTDQISLKIYYECIEAINSSGMYELKDELMAKMNDIIVRARKDNTATKGQRVSCMPPNSKRRRHHGVSHYK